MGHDERDDDGADELHGIPEVDRANVRGVTLASCVPDFEGNLRQQALRILATIDADGNAIDGGSGDGDGALEDRRAAFDLDVYLASMSPWVPYQLYEEQPAAALYLLWQYALVGNNRGELMLAIAYGDVSASRPGATAAISQLLPRSPTKALYWALRATRPTPTPPPVSYRGGPMPAAEVGHMSNDADRSLGLTQAAYFVGSLYRRMPELRNIERARYWLLRSATSSIDAVCTLGWMAVTGDEAPYDFDEGARWFTRGAADNDACCLLNLALMNAAGSGLPLNPALARTLYHRSCSLEPRWKLESLLATLRSDDDDDEIGACHDIGLAYQFGFVLPHDNLLALEHYYRFMRKSPAATVALPRFLSVPRRGFLWSPRLHHLYTPWFRRSVLTLVLLYCCCCAESLLSMLPWEMLFAVIEALGLQDGPAVTAPIPDHRSFRLEYAQWL